jgi:hypothetical protein
MAIDLANTASGYFSGAFSGWGKIALMFFLLVAILGLVIGSVWYMKSRKKYRIEIEIFRKMGDKWLLIKDMGASMKKEGIEYLRLKKLKKNLPFPALENFIAGMKGRAHIKMIQTSVSRIEPLKLSICNPEHEITAEREQSNWDLWYVSAGEIIEKSFQWKSLLMQWLPYIGVIVLVVGVIIVLSLIVQQLAPIAEQLAGVQAGLREIAGKLVGATEGGSGW